MSTAGKYKMGSISRKTGFSPMLLRAWERRHGLLEPERGSGGHRLYTEDDLQVLLHVKELLDQGSSIGEVALIGRDTLLAQRTRESGQKTDAPDENIADRTPIVGSEFGAYCRSIVDAAPKISRESLDRALDEAFARFSPDTVIHNVITPSAHEIGRLWMSGQLNVASEHLASDIFVQRIGKLLESAGLGLQRAPNVLCGCFPDENHRLGILILCYELTRKGVRIDFLGAAVPFEDLEQTIEVLRPRGVLLSVTRTVLFQTHRPRLIEAVRRHHNKTKFVIGGQGAPEVDPELTELGVELWDAKLEINKLLGRLGI